MADLTKQDQAVTLLQSSTSESDWNANIDKIKEANNGYPGWWYTAVIAPGLPQRVASGWGGSGEITITPIK